MLGIGCFRGNQAQSTGDISPQGAQDNKIPKNSKLVSDVITKQDLNHLQQLLEENPEWLNESFSLPAHDEGSMFSFPLLYIAASAGWTEGVGLLADKGAELDKCLEERGTTALRIAVAQEHLDTVRKLVELGASSDLPVVNEEAGGYNGHPLYIAVKKGNFDLLAALLEGPQPLLNAIKNANGDSLLHLAVQRGDQEMINLLLAHGAKNDETCVDRQGFTPLHMAVVKGDLEIVRKLIESCEVREAHDQGQLASGSVASESASEPLKNVQIPAVVKYVNATPQAESGAVADSPLLIALNGCRVRDNSEIVKLLMDSGARVLGQNADGRSLFHLAANYGGRHSNDTDKEFKEIMERFKNGGGRVGDRWKITDRKFASKGVSVKRMILDRSDVTPEARTEVLKDFGVKRLSRMQSFRMRAGWRIGHSRMGTQGPSQK